METSQIDPGTLKSAEGNHSLTRIARADGSLCLALVAKYKSTPVLQKNLPMKGLLDRTHTSEHCSNLTKVSGHHGGLDQSHN